MDALTFLVYYFLLYSDASCVDLCSFGAHLVVLLNEDATVGEARPCFMVYHSLHS